MSARILTIEAAKEAKCELVESGKGTQAVHDVVVALQAARRSGSANSKTKAEVNRSGRKPWRQKGTGRARAGSAGSPVWVGGGVVFGPKPRDYSKKVPKSVKRLALRKALTARITMGDVLVVDTFLVSEPKTKTFVSLLKGHTPEEKVLILSDAFDLNTFRAARNVQPALLLNARDVNTEQLLAYRKILITEKGLSQLAERTQ